MFYAVECELRLNFSRGKLVDKIIQQFVWKHNSIIKSCFRNLREKRCSIQHVRIIRQSTDTK